jgi:hypothetical protein
MTDRYFKVRVEGEAIIKLDQAVIDVVDDYWREWLYDLYTPEEIAAHVGANMICHNWPLHQMDGWADQPDENAQFEEYPSWEVIEVEELKND